MRILTLMFLLQLDRGWMGLLEGLPPYILASLPKDDLRILLEGLGLRMWFLGERTRRQYMSGFRRRPRDPPIEMFWGHELTNHSLDAALEGFECSSFLSHSKDYTSFLRTRCLPTLPLSLRMLAKVRILHIYFISI